MSVDFKKKSLEKRLKDKNLANKQLQAVHLALQGQNIFLTGKAGTGKTYVVKTIIEELRKMNRNVVVVAPTGIAASNAGGSTINSLFSISINGILGYEDCFFVKSSKRRLFSYIDTVVIDEVSMLRPDVLDAINWTMLKNGCDGLDKKQIIFVGDLKQLPAPLSDNALSVLFTKYSKKEFTGATIMASLNVETIELDEIKRQSDPDFIEALNIVRDGGKSAYFKNFLHKEAKGVILAPYNSTVSIYNKKGLEAQEGKLYKYTAVYDGNGLESDFNLEKEIEVKDGCRIMYLVNSRDNDLRNGTIGIFRIKDGKPFFEKDGNLYELSLVELEKKEYILNEKTKEIELITIGSIKQYPFKLAYAMSIHKSQGLTFEEVTIDLSSPCFQEGQLYTALSRVTAPSGLRIIVGNRI